MNHFIFKSANRLIKNETINIARLLDQIQTELRAQRQEHKDMSLKLEKLLIDKHLQMQVDEYFEDNPQEKPAEADLS